jgi:hypothetical protein
MNLLVLVILPWFALNAYSHICLVTEASDSGVLNQSMIRGIANEFSV